MKRKKKRKKGFLPCLQIVCRKARPVPLGQKGPFVLLVLAQFFLDVALIHLLGALQKGGCQQLLTMLTLKSTTKFPPKLVTI